MPRACIRRCGRGALPGSSRCGICSPTRRWKPRVGPSPYGYQHQLLRQQVLREEPTCRYRYPGCTIISTTADHIIPLVLGGTTTRENMAGACAHCNNRKGGRVPQGPKGGVPGGR